MHPNDSNQGDITKKNGAFKRDIKLIYGTCVGKTISVMGSAPIHLK